MEEENKEGLTMYEAIIIHNPKELIEIYEIV